MPGGQVVGMDSAGRKGPAITEKKKKKVMNGGGSRILLLLACKCNNEGLRLGLNCVWRFYIDDLARRFSLVIYPCRTDNKRI